MIIDNKDAKQELLYTAYGFSVYGTIATYEWTYDRSGRTEKCLTRIAFYDSANKELCNRYLGNNVIFMKLFDEHIDNILWFLNHETVDSWTIDHEIIQKVLIENVSLLSHRVQQRKDKEKQAEDNKRRYAEQEAKEKVKKDEIREFCSKKKLHCNFIYNQTYVFKIHKSEEKVAALLDKADDTIMKSYVDYSLKRPVNEISFIYAGSELDKVLPELKELLKHHK